MSDEIDAERIFSPDPDDPNIIRVGPPGGGLYNVVFGQQPIAQELVLVIQAIRPVNIGRFRDAWLERCGDELLIRIHTRNGGGNRPDYDHPSMSEHPWFVRTEDMEFDNTYADYWYRVDPRVVSREMFMMLNELAVEPVDMSERWAQAIENLKRHGKEGKPDDGSN